MTTDIALDHAHQLFYGDLAMCGCGTPEAAYELVRDLLALIADHERDWAPLAKTLIGNPGAYHLTMSALDEAGLLEHGSSIDSAWLTDKGRWYASALRTIESWDGLEGYGYPHGMESCTEACWQIATDL
ncbi:hypothetical protein ABZW11_17115 [Nonomuraea sp. NPDC004580]|uniref:hypothetical protein n=1 Tax=Nonomuraea sp. NPDC004580 TaxID=3154552 RepID=UPI0033B27242